MNELTARVRTILVLAIALTLGAGIVSAVVQSGDDEDTVATQDGTTTTSSFVDDLTTTTTDAFESTTSSPVVAAQETTTTTATTQPSSVSSEGAGEVASGELPHPETGAGSLLVPGMGAFALGLLVRRSSQRR